MCWTSIGATALGLGTLLQFGSAMAQAELFEQMGWLAGLQAKSQAAVAGMQAKMYQIEAGLTMQIGELNREIAETQALSIEKRYGQAVRDLRREGSQVVGAQRAGYAKAGVALDVGTPIEVMSETYQLIEENIANMEEQGEVEAAITRMGGAVAQAEAGILSTRASTQAGISQMMVNQSWITGQAQAYGYQAKSWGAEMSAYGSLLQGGGKMATLLA